MGKKPGKSQQIESATGKASDAFATEAAPENTGRKPDGTFAHGNSVNPAGRPKGALNKTTLAMLELMEGEADVVTRKCIELAKSGDMQAMKLFFERIVPPSKSRRIKLDLPPIVTVEDCLTAQGKITAAMAEGELSPDEAATMASVVEMKRKAIETLEFEKRLDALEKEKGLT